MFTRNKLFIFSFLLTVYSTANLKSARAQNNVTVEVKILNQDKDKGLMPFSLNRPLRIDDFKGNPKRTSPGVAATFSGIKMAIAAKEENGQTTAIVTLFPYFKIQESWMKKNGKNPQVLAHEQIHFDLTAIQTCRLANAIRSTAFNANWHQHLLDMRAKYMDQLKQLQDQYDSETHHGTIVPKQEAYQKMIIAQLKQQDCY